MDRAETTQLLVAARDGSDAARAALFERLYAQLRHLASRQLDRLRGGSPGALQTTELVHEAYLKLCDAERLSAHDRAHFLALAARCMRQVLIDHFRGRASQKRGGPLPKLALDAEELAADERGELLLALDDALRRLQAINDRGSRIVEMKFFAGMSESEMADELDLSVRTVAREWRFARAWLTRELQAS